MYRLYAILLLLFAVAPFGAAKSRHVMFRLHAEANPADTAAFSTSVRAQLSGKDVSIEKVARITERDVQAFYPYPLGKGQFGALFQLDEHGRLTLDALSVERRGTYLFVFIKASAVNPDFISRFKSLKAFGVAEILSNPTQDCFRSSPK